MSNPYIVSIGDFFFFTFPNCFANLSIEVFGYDKGNAFIYLDSQRGKDGVSNPFVNLNIVTATKFGSSQNHCDVT